MARLARNSARMPFRVAAGAIALVGLVGIPVLAWHGVAPPEGWVAYVLGALFSIDMAILAATGRFLFLHVICFGVVPPRGSSNDAEAV